MAPLTASELAAERAAARCAFQLTYARSPVPRRFRAGSLSGPPIPCAYGGDIDASGHWEDGGDAVFHERDEAGWVDRYANYAINEAVHEALEWFRVDGRPWLDPHGDLEDAIYAEVNALCERLAAIRAEVQ